MAQLSNELQLVAKKDRQGLVEEIMKLPGNFKVVVSSEQSLAMKTDLQIPWNKLRVMRRYMTEKCVAQSHKSIYNAHHYIDG